MSALCLFTRCVDQQSDKAVIKNNTAAKHSLVEFNQFAGIETCAKCHPAQTNSFIQTPHFHSSHPASAASITGSFKKGQNSFKYGPGKIVSLEKQQDSFYQVYYHNGKKVVQRRFDIVIGSGTKGQTYLSWIGNHLIELPVSYFTQAHQWANSPGYPLSPIIFNRPVTARCLECHSTYAQTINYDPNIPPAFDSTKMILTISCEKCHGPAAKHVAWHSTHTNDTVARFIINPSRLSRQRSLDVCALCHSGRLDAQKPPFQFVAGDSLTAYFGATDIAKRTGIMDVHGNQLGILEASKCFRVSKTMTCNTCHDPHANESGNATVFSQRCVSCHTAQHQPIKGVSNAVLISNCIDCHMPLQESTSISFFLQGKEQPVNAIMRTHFIKVYANETKKFIEKNTALAKKKS